MPKLNTTVKSVRVDNDKLEELEKRLDGRSINSWLNEAIENFLNGGEVNPPKKEVNPSKDGYLIRGDEYRELQSMCGFVGGSMDAVIRLTTEALTNGIIIFDGKRYVGVDPALSTDKFKEVCHDMGLDCQEVLDEATKKLRKGIL